MMDVYNIFKNILYVIRKWIKTHLKIIITCNQLNVRMCVCVEDKHHINYIYLQLNGSG